MAASSLILNRYEPLGAAGAGGFGTVTVAWDPRIQRKVAIKVIPLTEVDAQRALSAEPDVGARDGEVGASAAHAAADPPADSAARSMPPASSAASSARVAAPARSAAEATPVAPTAAWDGVLPWEEGAWGEAATPEPLVSAASDPSGKPEAPAPAASAVARDSSASPFAVAPRDAVASRDAEGSASAALPSQRGNGGPAEFVSPFRQAVRSTLSRGFAMRTPPTLHLPADSIDPIALGDSASDPAGRPNADEGSARPARAALARIPGIDEARTAAQLHDPRIVTVYDVQVVGLDAYLIMEYVEGVTLGRLLDAYGDLLTLDMAAAVFDAVAGALAVAHRRGVLHLDIKPDNILIDADGQVKVTDFGLATLADAAGQGHTGGGTIGYMPLEQMRRAPLDVRTDEWSLASVCYEMLVGSNPFICDSLDEAQAAIEGAELVLPSLCWDDLSDQADDVLLYALAPHADHRYETVTDFAEELERFLGDADQGGHQLSLVVRDALGLPLGIEGSLEEGIDELPADGYGDEDDFDDEGATTARRGLLGRRRSGTFDGGSGGSYERIPMSAHITPRMVRIASHVAAALGCAGLAYLAGINMPFVAGVSAGPVPASLVVALAAGIVGAARPQAGSIVGLSALSAAFIMGATPLAGIVLLAVSLAWWYAVGMRSAAASNVALATPLLTGVGFGPLVPLVAGASLRPVAAMLTTALSVVWAAVLAAVGTGSLAGWDIVSFSGFSQVHVETRLGAMLGGPTVWCLAAGWVLAALVQAALCLRGTRVLQVVGAVAGGAVLVASAVLARWLATGGAQATPAVDDLVPMLVSVLMVSLFMGIVRPDAKRAL
ncbi:serine/threonine-protein kinase [Berryella wangjianweii]|uniref:serine/threonine-protein kinase n=1 Tax=Berryella wangjianweii TaxID=2734634 RepID=UPI0028F73043|nr:serine/threonine-protein kinase [Berryella wangjianweii]